MNALRKTFDFFFQTDFPQRFPHSHFVLFFTFPQQNIFRHGRRIQPVILQQRKHVFPDSGSADCPISVQLPGKIRIKPQQHFQEGGLSCAILPDQHNAFPFFR